LWNKMENNMNMKIICITAALMFAAFVACENPNSGADNGDADTDALHVHQWGKWGPDATCYEKVLQTRVCALDETHIEEQVAPKVPHTYGDWEEWEPEGGGIGERIACMVCDTTKDSKLTGGGGIWLTFTKINNDAEYRVSKVSADATEGIIIIPARYRETDDDEYLPVTDISGTTNTNANSAFGGNATNATKIFSVTIPATVKTIATYAFYGCTSLQDVTFAEGSEVSIGNNAFMNCSSLGSIEIPEGVTSIGNTVFRGCTALTSVVFPAGVTSIPTSLFQGCSNLTEVVIPSSVTAIGSYVFRECTGLINIDIPSGVTSIQVGLFQGCTNLASVTIPEGVTSIASNAFSSCASLTSITIPASVTTIATQAFSGCTKLEVITFLAETPPTLPDRNVFANVYDYMEIKVPAASVQAYKTAQWWKLEADFISAIE
jgi:hypothetical protein